MHDKWLFDKNESAEVR